MSEVAISTERTHACDLAALTAADALSVYAGAARKCCCGCAGTHSYNSKYLDEAGRKRGYAVGIDELDDGEVERVVQRVQAIGGPEWADDKSHVAVEKGRRQYIVYLTEAARLRFAAASAQVSQ